MVLKVIGLLFLRDIILAIPAVIIGVAGFFTGDSFELKLEFLLPSLLILLYLVTMLNFLLFRTESVVRWLRLVKDNNDTEQVTFSMHRSTVFMMIITIISCLILLDEIPHLFNTLAGYLKAREFFGTTRPDTASLLIPGFRIGLAALLLIYQRTLINLFDAKRKRHALDNGLSNKDALIHEDRNTPA